MSATVSPTRAVAAPAVMAATAFTVQGRPYDEERRLPGIEPDARPVILVIGGATALAFQTHDM